MFNVDVNETREETRGKLQVPQGLVPYDPTLQQSVHPSILWRRDSEETHKSLCLACSLSSLLSLSLCLRLSPLPLGLPFSFTVSLSLFLVVSVWRRVSACLLVVSKCLAHLQPSSGPLLSGGQGRDPSASPGPQETNRDCEGDS